MKASPTYTVKACMSSISDNVRFSPFFLFSMYEVGCIDAQKEILFSEKDKKEKNIDLPIFNVN